MNATKAMTLLAAVAVGFSAQALTLSVKDVKIAQRYPWNGLVDIDYTVECDDPDAEVYVYPTGYDKDYQTTKPLWYLSGDGATNGVKAGTHRMTWNMGKQMGNGYNRAAFSIKMSAYAGAAPYMVIDLAAGANAEKYPVSYLTTMPGTTWPDEYKTTKLVLKLIPSGTYTMGDGSGDSSSYYTLANYRHQVTLTQPFYCSVFEVTYQQWKAITGTSLTGYVANNPARGMNYNDLRGATLGAQFPSHNQVDATSFLGKLRTRTGVTFDLPTEAQWEYVAGVGLAVFQDPNVWGIYGMTKIPAEWCRDWMASLNSYASVVDPVGAASGSYRAVRGLGYGDEYSSSWYYVNGGKSSSTYTDYAISNQRRAYCACWGIASAYLRPGYSAYDPQSVTVNGTWYTVPAGTFGCRLIAIPGDGTK